MANAPDDRCESPTLNTKTPKTQKLKNQNRTRIKICGVKDIETAAAAVAAGADMLGLVFVKKSPRYIDFATAKTIVDSLPDSVRPVALTQGFSRPQQFFELTEATGIRCVQLHGDEPPSVADGLEACGYYGLIRALPAEKIEDGELLAAWAAYESLSCFLWDAPSSPDDPLGGGTGRTSDWVWLAERLPAVPFVSILAGGLTPGNVGEAIRTVQPWGVDVSSGVESSRGVKDVGMIADFCAAVRAADADAGLTGK